MNTYVRRAAAISLAFLVGVGAAVALLRILLDPPRTRVNPINIEVDESPKERGEGAQRDPKRPRQRDRRPRNGGDAEPGGGAEHVPPVPPPPAGDGNDDNDDGDDGDDGDDDNDDGDDGDE